MHRWALWIILIVAVLIASLAGILAIGTFIRAQSICPDFFDCEDARNASVTFLIVAVAGALGATLASWGLGGRKVVVR